MTGSLARVPCTIVTGFLGAGKTTLIRHVLGHAQGRKLAVIVNEFGDVGIDGEILKANPRDGDGIIIQGQLLNRGGHPEQAVSLLEGALKNDAAVSRIAW